MTIGELKTGVDIHPVYKRKRHAGIWLKINDICQCRVEKGAEPESWIAVGDGKGINPKEEVEVLE